MSDLWSSGVTSILTQMIVVVGCVLLFRAKRTIPAFIMVVGSVATFVLHLLALAWYLEFLSASWLYYLIVGLDLSASRVASILFAVGLLWFGISHSRGLAVNHSA